MWKTNEDSKNKMKYFTNAMGEKVNTDFINCIDYANAMAREIYLYNLTPASAETIEKTIRF